MRRSVEYDVWSKNNGLTISTECGTLLFFSTKCRTRRNVASTKSRMRPIIVSAKWFSTNCHAPKKYNPAFCAAQSGSTLFAYDHKMIIGLILVNCHLLLIFAQTCLTQICLHSDGRYHAFCGIWFVYVLQKGIYSHVG